VERRGLRVERVGSTGKEVGQKRYRLRHPVMSMSLLDRVLAEYYQGLLFLKWVRRLRTFVPTSVLLHLQ
jgi:hypothetical protein